MASDAAAEEYRGNIYFDGNDFTCNLPFSEEIPYYVGKSIEFIRQIVEECTAAVPSDVPAPARQSR